MRPLLFVLLISAAARDASARARLDAGAAHASTAPSIVQPVDGASVHEAAAHFEVALTPDARDAKVVVARFRFDTSGWASLPAGPGWIVLPYRDQPVAMASLGLADQTDTHLWWAVVWTDARTGSLRASRVRQFTLVPRFSNRVAQPGALLPINTGRVATSSALPGAPAAARPAIELAAGFTLLPWVTPPLLPSRVRREGEAPAPAGEGRDGYLVQFADDSPDSARARIANAGGTLVWPMAGNAWLVRLDPESLAALERTTGEPWITAYEPAHKLSLAFPDTASGPVAVTALLFEDGDGGAAMAALRALGASRLESHRSKYNQLVRFELDRARLTEAAALPNIAWIEPTPVYTANNDLAQWVLQTGVQDQRKVYDHGLRGQGQLVMTSDSGIRTNHEMFNDSTLAINDFGDAVAFDYHGTHTGGTVAGDPTPFSSARWSGLAREARLYFMDVGSSAGGGLSLPADLNELYQPSYEGNAAGPVRISSNSWGAFVQARYTLPSMQVDQFVWNHPDYLIAFSSGNIGTFASVGSPGTSKNVITVGATGNGADQTKLASFSSRGPVKDGRRKPTLMAPGDGVTSSVGSTRYAYGTYSGTSMSTPAVAGAMALVRQYLTEGWYPTGAPVASNSLAPSAALMRAIAVAASRNDITGFRAPDNTIGYGRLTIDDVLYFPGDTLRTLLVDAGDGLTDQQFVEYQVEVTDPSAPLKVSLAWTDAPGNPASQVSIVNDLDLIVSHDGTSYRGNALLNNISAPNGPRDSLNVEELVRLPAPTVGLYTVRIEGHHVAMGPQRFALCVTGGVGGPAGAVALDRFEYGLDDTLEIEVVDTDAPEPVVALVSSGSEQGEEQLILSGSHGVFRGSIVLSPETALHGDGKLAVTSGDQVTVTYLGTAQGVPLVATARIHVQAPTITQVHARALGSTHAEITWTTDIASTSRVRFGSAGALGTVVDSSGFVMSHTVLLTGLAPATTYAYDVAGVAVSGDASCDSLDGAHRTFTTQPNGSIALLIDDPDPAVLATWNNAFDALGWDVDVFPAALNDPPLVGSSTVGLRSYNAVIWQLDPDRYPPLTDAQRVAIDSLMEGGTRLLVTGHDIGFGLSDAGAPSYTPEREAWLERSLKSRYYIDNLNADTLIGVAGSPVAGAFADSLYYALYLYADSGDNFGPAPGSDGVWTGDWTDNYIRNKYLGMHWESNAPKGTPGQGVWGGEKSRLVGLFYEWRALESAATEHRARRTAVLHDAVAWLVGHRPPEARIVSPVAGKTIKADFLPVWFSIKPDAGRAITRRELEYSLDDGETWTPAVVCAWNDSMAVWDLASALDGPVILNTTRARLRLLVTDDGTPALRTTASVSGPFTIQHTFGDSRGPVLVAGSASCSSVPLRQDRPATLFATFSDAETGAGVMAGAEYSIGATPLDAGTGIPMSGTFGGVTVQASAPLATASVGSGALTYWVRGRDGKGNWSEASPLSIPTVGSGAVRAAGADGAVAVDFLASPTPNPFRGRATLRFGLAREGDVQLELFDVSGRSVRTLAAGKVAAGEHTLTWDGRDRQGHDVKAGVYFVRLRTPSRTFHSRVVSLR